MATYQRSIVRYTVVNVETAWAAYRPTMNVSVSLIMPIITNNYNNAKANYLIFPLSFVVHVMFKD